MTRKERELLGSVFGAAQVATSESFASEKIFENFFKAISSYPDRMSSSKTHKWLMEPREFVQIASRTPKTLFIRSQPSLLGQDCGRGLWTLWGKGPWDVSLGFHTSNDSWGPGMPASPQLPTSSFVPP